MKVHQLQVNYGLFRKGQCVYYEGRRFYVVAVPPGIIAEGNVAIESIHDIISRFYEVPAEDLDYFG